MIALTIASFMTVAPHTIRADQNVDTARRLMRQYKVRHLPVMDGQQVVGIVSQRDLGLFGGADGDEARLVLVSDIMTREVASVPPETPVAEAASEMARTRAGSILVERHGALLGIFTTTDALRVLARLAGGGNRP